MNGGNESNEGHGSNGKGNCLSQRGAGGLALVPKSLPSTATAHGAPQFDYVMSARDEGICWPNDEQPLVW